MALEALSSSDLFNFIMYDSNISASATPFISSSDTSPQETINGMPPPPPPQSTEPARKKRRRRPKVCKNKEEAETQRMTHIAVERNRRKQMNEHLAVLRSLMPDSYVQRGDQASIVGGAIEFVKELEHILQTLEAKKFALLGHHHVDDEIKNMNMNSIISTTDHDNNIIDQENNNKQIRRSSNSSSSPFGQFFAYPQFSCSSQKYTSQTKAAIADIEVTLIETHANIRVLSRRRLRQLSKIVASFHAVFLTILHLNVTTLDDLVLYSISAKVEEGCQLNSADDIAAAVHHMLRIIEEEAILGCET